MGHFVAVTTNATAEVHRATCKWTQQLPTLLPGLGEHFLRIERLIEGLEIS